MRRPHQAGLLGLSAPSVAVPMTGPATLGQGLSSGAHRMDRTPPELRARSTLRTQPHLGFDGHPRSSQSQEVCGGADILVQETAARGLEGHFELGHFNQPRPEGLAEMSVAQDTWQAWRRSRVSRRSAKPRHWPVSRCVPRYSEAAELKLVENFQEIFFGKKEIPTR